MKSALKLRATKIIFVLLHVMLAWLYGGFLWSVNFFL